MNMNYLFMYLYHFLFLLSEFCIFHIQILLFILLRSHLGFPGSSAGKESACNAGDLGSLDWEDSLDEGIHPMDKEAWQTTVQTQLSS